MSTAKKIMILICFFYTCSVSATSLNLDEQLPKIVDSNGRQIYDKYDQPSREIWERYLKRKGLTKLQDFLSIASDIASDSEDESFQELDRMVLPLYIKDETANGIIEIIEDINTEAETMYDQDEKAIDDMESILEVIGPEETTDENGILSEETFIDLPVLFEGDTDIQEELLESRWGKFKNFRTDLDVDSIEEDLEKYLIMNEQEKMSIIGGRGDMEDYLINRDYQMQKNTINYLAKILVTKKKLVGLTDTIPSLPPSVKLETKSLQDIMKQKKILLDYLDQLWALKRQLEDISYQFEIAKRGKNLNIKEPVIYRFDNSSKRISPKNIGP